MTIEDREVVELLQALLDEAEGLRREIGIWHEKWRKHTTRSQPANVEPRVLDADMARTIFDEIKEALNAVKIARERPPHVVFVPLFRADELRDAARWLTIPRPRSPSGLYYGAEIWLADVPRIVAGRKVRQP